MNNAQQMRLTAKGQALMARISAGDGSEVLEITRIVAGSGKGSDPLAQDAVLAPVCELWITGRHIQDRQATIFAGMDNAGVEQETEIWQIGIYAMDGGEEILFRILQFDEMRRMPPESELTWSYTPEFHFGVHNTQLVEIQISQAGHVMRSEMEERIDNMPRLYVSGEKPSWRARDTWYQVIRQVSETDFHTLATKEADENDIYRMDFDDMQEGICDFDEGTLIALVEE